MKINLPQDSGSVLVFGLVTFISVTAAGSLFYIKRSDIGTPTLSRQASLKFNDIQDESDTSDDPRPYVAEESLRLTRDVLMPLNEQVRGPLERRPDFRTPLPFVFVLGNHSSGKSSFINYVLQRKIQEMGVAPTDDGFSIIAPGPNDVEMDGPSLVGNDFGFAGLRSFGSGLVEHVKMKIRSKLGLQEVILIDSPGMIDSPADTGKFKSVSDKKDRGYDFEGVARWFAERADVILLFFDPDKPGTTGETLSVLTHALSGMDHKLLIVLNKVDMFQRTNDFARSYGALCWNLAKVIPRKDLPRIFTTYTPGTQSSNTESSSTLSKETRAELDSVREELIGEIRLAPFRRMDNHITTLYDQTRVLKMHTEILQDVRSAYRTEKKKAVGFTLLGGTFGAILLGAAVSKDADSVTPAIAVGLGIVPCLITILYGVFKVRGKYHQLTNTDEGLEECFRRRFKQELAERDESVKGVWERVRPQIKVALEHFSLEQLPKVGENKIKDLDKIINIHVPSLRRKAANRFARVGGS